MVIALENRGLSVIENDITQKDGMDATKAGIYDIHRPDWIITNPPFNKAFSILTMALSRCENVAMILRLSFLEPTKTRGIFLSITPPSGLIILPRMSFTEDGKTDSVTCAWMIWSKEIKNKFIEVSNW